MLGYRPHETQQMDQLSFRQMQVGFVGWRRAREAEAAVFGRVLFGEGEGGPARLDPREVARKIEGTEAMFQRRGWPDKLPDAIGTKTVPLGG